MRDAYPIARVDEYIDALGDAVVLLALYVNSGDGQIPIPGVDIEETAFACHSVYSGGSGRLPDCLTPRSFQPALDIILPG